MDSFVYVFFWFGFAIVVGVAADTRGRNGIGWFLLAVVISPLLAGLLLLVGTNNIPTRWFVQSGVSGYGGFNIGDASLIPGGFGVGDKSVHTSYKSNTAVNGDDIIGTNVFYAESLGDNTNYIGSAAGWFVAADSTSVSSGTKGVLNALNVSAVPKIARNNGPVDDVVGIGIYNNGTVPGTDGIYFGHEQSGNDWNGSCIEIGAYGTHALNCSGTYSGSAINVANQGGGTSLQTGTGNVKFGGAFGYAPSGAGIGDVVTQQTNKSTSLQIDKICGKVTMNNAALNAGAQVSFTVNNNKVAGTDVVVVSTGSSTAAYQLTVNRITDGTFDIVVLNGSGSNLSEALQINFAVIKSVID